MVSWDMSRDSATVLLNLFRVVVFSSMEPVAEGTSGFFSIATDRAALSTWKAGTGEEGGFS